MPHSHAINPHQPGSAFALASDTFGLLKSQVTRSAYQGLGIAAVCVVVASMAAGYMDSGEVSISAVINAQSNNVALWILNLTPFAFLLWGQYASSVIAHQASTVILDQTNIMQAQTREIEQKAVHEATHDTLTDMPNRILFIERLDQALIAARRNNTSVAVLVLDINHFRDINDTLGFNNGDQLVKQMAFRLATQMREGDSVARVGGDKFAVLSIVDNGLNDALDNAERLLEALRTPYQAGGLKLDVQVTLGIAVSPEHGADGDTLLQRADLAMHGAKKEQTALSVYSSQHDRHNPRRLSLMAELRETIENNQLTVCYQPKIDLKTGEVIAVESLVRWEHPELGAISPEEFVPIAERTGLIRPLTDFVTLQALSQCSAWRRLGIELQVAINISTHALMDPMLPERFAKLLDEKYVHPTWVMLEITETAIMRDQERAKVVLDEIAGMGVRLSIDDFGTGHSSLAYLSCLPVHELKIDKSFVMDMDHNTHNAMIVQATIDLAHNLGLSVVAEGVESSEIASLLKDIGCDIAQGYHFGAPMVASDLTAQLFATQHQHARPEPKSA